MKTLLIARTIKSYWDSDYAKRRITRIYAPFNGWRLWRIFGGVFSWPLYFLVAFLGFLKSANFDLVIVTDPRIGLLFGLLKKIFNSKKPLLVHQLILKVETSTFKEKILKFAFEKIDAAVVNSSFEQKNFSARFPKTIFFFIPLHSDPVCFELAKRKKVDRYIFSGGGAERDFATLIKAAKKINFRFLIVTFSEKFLPKISLPKNVEVKFNVPEDEYFNLIADSKFVVIPLKKVGRSAGQTTVVQAMAIGKTVIASKIPALLDYIKDEKNGIFVKPENVDDLVGAINELLQNNQKLKKLSKKAADFARNNFDYRIYDQRMSRVFNKVVGNLQ